MSRLIIGVLVGVVVAAGAGTAVYLTTRDDGPNEATRLGCRMIAEAVVRADSSDVYREDVRALIGDAMVVFRDSNDDVIHDAADKVELSYTTLDDALFRSSMRTIDARCREHYAFGWDG